MKEIKLLSLIVRNFMGIKKAGIEPGGEDILVIGENEVGKTRFATGWHWLLFDKDIKGKSDFDIKWLGENNNVKDPGLEYEVEGTLTVNGTKKTLKKVYYEKWQKKKGSNEARFTGHTTDYYIDEVPMKKKEYDKKIDEIIDEETFRMLTDPDCFCGKMHWEDRREILMDAFGGVSDKEIIKKNDNLSELMDIIEERDIDDHKEVCKSKMKKINKEIKKIPVRIDEVNNNLPDISGYYKEKIQAEINEYKDKKNAKEQELSQIENGGEVAELKKKITEIDTELHKIKNNYRSEYEDKLQKKKNELSEVKDAIGEQERDIRSTEKSIKELNSIIEKKEQKMQELRNKWHRENKIEFDESQFKTVTCPDCGCEFPLEDIEKHREKFNQEKAEVLEDINRQGKEQKEKVKKIQANIADKKEFLEESKSNLEELQEEKADLEDEIEALQKEANMYQDSNQYQDKLKGKEQLQDKIEKVKEDNQFSVEAKEKEIEQFEDKLEELKDQLSDIKQHEKSQDRIEELKSKEEKLAKKYEEFQQQVYLCDEFTKTKVNMLEGKINSKFNHTDWKLFDELVNGGIDETCEALYKGVEYNSTLNTGTKILVGIDVINTLSEHYGIRVPVFVDNVESVTHDLKSKCQLIKLKAVEGVKKLTVKKAEKEMKEAS